MKRILKSSLLLLFIVLVAGVQQISAQSLKEFFNSSEIPLTYLGVDFTRAKILNEVAANNIDIRDRQFPAINQVIVNEPKKYDFQKAFSKTTVNNDIALVNAKNAKIDAEKMVESGSDAVHLKNTDIDAILQKLAVGRN